MHQIQSIGGAAWRPRFLAVSVLAIGLLGLATTSQATPLTFDGITFEDGVKAFADEVVSFTVGTLVDDAHDNPGEALGIPDHPSGSDINYVSLGNNDPGVTGDATLILRFTDNSLTPSGDGTADLHVFEIGDAIEKMEISISKDLVSWIVLGVLEGQPTSIDIDAANGVVFGDLFSYVRIVDAGEGASGSPFAGADIDAVGAISSGSAAVPLPAALPLLLAGLAGLGLVGWRRQRAA